MTRLEQIKRIHNSAIAASQRYDESGNISDFALMLDRLHELFASEHTDWLIEQAEKMEQVQ